MFSGKKKFLVQVLDKEEFFQLIFSEKRSNCKSHNSGTGYLVGLSQWSQLYSYKHMTR